MGLLKRQRLAEDAYERAAGEAGLLDALEAHSLAAEGALEATAAARADAPAGSWGDNLALDDHAFQEDRACVVQ